MINYILQVILFQVLFLAIYDFFLSKETFFTKNRWYLLSTPILSFLIPLIKIPTFRKAVPQEFFIQLPEIVLNPDKVIKESITTDNFTESINYINILFWIGVTLCTFLFLIKLVKIINFIKKYGVQKLSDFSLIMIPNETKAFSFFNYIFLGAAIKETNRDKIIKHEIVHSQQKHSLDLLLFEFLKIVMWFNPMIYVYQKRITLIHEYISDAEVSKSENKESYINNLLSNFFQVENIMFINQFYKPTFIKKRITMMTKKQSKKMNQLKYLVLIPVLASMLFYTSCSDESSTEIIENKLELQKMYFSFKDGEIKTSESKDKYSYFDIYVGVTVPSDFKKTNLESLSTEERTEFDTMFKGEKERGSDLSQDDHQLYQTKTGRKVLIHLYNPDDYKKGSTDSKTETEEVSFMVIDKVPTFPGCEEGDRKCFSLMVQKHFTKNFDSEMPKTLGLAPGRKRVFIAFKIDKEGDVVDVKVRAPHEEIKNEVLNVMNSLPKMTPGEHQGKNITVKYSIPFTIFIE
ncbi:BlaR1 peptidase M56 [Polaribacter reichenbachii]|uniref:BlaR1 peptidase M56 n=1 Tax=Polaribacter reichenbachii TaxID=996801 RepID=A0A1B8TW35_9FLAO|nr:M56 family metallopeptidase [Polaribacter reichenbachii]APZ45163.1 BlaR1 peptidase M56 [Polaribacter reichenbachii]AUC19025.1 BlaR1 peptidase M56 [Polaribacter reichenbachii]OBY63818.1 BlaR1 peptidase M56 [Polaribacter reichenbachii]